MSRSAPWALTTQVDAFMSIVSPSRRLHRTVRGVRKERRNVRLRSGYRVLCIGSFGGTPPGQGGNVATTTGERQAFQRGDPTNVTPAVRGSGLRIAETRAVNRALRKAYGIGNCSVEELGCLLGVRKCGAADDHRKSDRKFNGSNNSQPRLRDELCLLIRQYNLNPTLIKAYGADFCCTKTLSRTSRDLVESFVSHLAAAAKEKRKAGTG